jgi:UDP-N-acetylmuramoyl-tripeptide--D-alanyl-D-alanine ligase
MKKLLSWPILWYLRFLARLSLSIHQPIVIGIAGSVGKSSTRNALYAMLKDHAPTKVISGNSETGVPLGILGITAEDFSLTGWLLMVLRAPLGIFFTDKTQYLIIEMGIDDPYPPKNMSYLLTIVKPQYAIALNISPTHTQQFEKTLQEKAARHVPNKEKMHYLLQRIAEEDTKIITDSDCKIGIYNADDPYIKERIMDYLILHRKTTILSFGKSAQNDISYAGYKVTLQGTQFSFLLKSELKQEKISLFLEGYVLPKEYQEVIAAGFLTAYQLGITISQMKSSFEKNFSLPKGRSTILTGIKKSVIIDSSYNASPSAVTAFLELMGTLREQTKRPSVFLFGDMRELGDEAEETHKAIAEKIPDAIQYVFLVGPLTKSYVLPELKRSKKLKELRWFPDARAAGKYLRENLPVDSLVLIKGSQNTIFLEETVRMLLADPADAVLLCRQDKYWKDRKAVYFNG